MHGGMQGTFETSFTWGSPLSRSGDCGFAQRGPGTLEVLIAGTFSEVPSAQDTLPPGSHSYHLASFSFLLKGPFGQSPVPTIFY